MAADATRAARLGKALDGILSGRTQISSRNSTQFLEAICAQTDPPACLNKLISSAHGLPSVQSAMRFDLSVTFLNGQATAFLGYISSPELSSIGGGEYLKNLLRAVVNPSFFLDAYVRAFRAKELDEPAQLTFAWLLYQLLLFPSDYDEVYRDLAADPEILNPLIASESHEVRVAGERIKHVLQTQTVGDFENAEFGPGGRHDNDKVDFREIAIVPTADEITSKQPPFLRKSIELEDPTVGDSLVADYLDNHFRLLREDMIYELREELQAVLEGKRKRQRAAPVDHLKLVSAHYALDQPTQAKWKRGRWSVLLQRTQEFPFFAKMGPPKRRDWLKDNYRFLKHRSLACVLLEKEIIAFATVDRNEDMLACSPPVLVLQFEGEANTVRALMRMKDATNLALITIDVAVFAYEPILKTLQEIRTLPLAEEILYWSASKTPATVSRRPLAIVDAVRRDPSTELQTLIGTPKSIKLDNSQAQAFVAGMTQAVALIQGPPGTGKSFIGALLAKTLYEFTSETILVVCFKNHALDDLLSGLLDIGVPESQMLRLGGKSTPRTEPMSLFNIIQQSGTSNYKFGRADWVAIDSLKQDINTADNALNDASTRFMNTNTEDRDIMELIEFEDEDYFHAMKVPSGQDGMRRVGKKGKVAGPSYLYHQWSNGWDAGVFRDAANVMESAAIWAMPPNARKRKIAEWKESLLKEQAVRIRSLATGYNHAHHQLARKFDERNGAIVRSRRIIGCTTTAAAMYRDEINAASPDVILIEEAGEILESHIIAALSAKTKQIIMIGDHKQLRPKVNSYTLSVDSHEGFDLNRSLFERLVRRDFPHQTLSQQHRMRPEISTLVRSLTYPNLVDAPSTKGRSNLRGVRDNIVFIHHEQPEDDLQEMAGSHLTNEANSKSSKQNSYEVEMILKILRYLGQQGYGTDKIVILTPYLGQLRALQLALKATVDPVLNDLDSADLVRAGLVTPAAANVSKQPIRLATIDNYQGEESEIVLASMTRSNPQNTIGFMSSPERVNVLLSRARDALIMIGNAHTFQGSRHGKETWGKLFGMLKTNGNLYDGLPTQCERHPDRTALLTCPDDFERFAPDGGCSQPCGAKLACGHSCKSKCHQIFDHSKMTCEEVLYNNCAKGHKLQYMCKQGPPDGCFKCDREKKMEDKRKKEEFARQERHDREQRAHVEKIAELDAQIAREHDSIRAAQLAEERAHALRQKEKDLRDAAALASRAAAPTSPPALPASPTATPDAPRAAASASPAAVAGLDASAPSSPPSSSARAPHASQSSSPYSSTPAPPKRRSEAREDWERRKNVDGEVNSAIDEIMAMGGLERVKATVLDIKDAVDTAKRQGTSLKDQRFSVSMLGNHDMKMRRQACELRGYEMVKYTDYKRYSKVKRCTFSPARRERERGGK